MFTSCSNVCVCCQNPRRCREQEYLHFLLDSKRRIQPIKGFFSMNLFYLIARLVVGAIFVLASYHKIMDPEAFAVSIRNYMIIPNSYSNLLALTLPWVEMGAGLLLIAGILVKPAALLTTGMLISFLGTLVYAYAINLDIDCGCFSSANSSDGRIGIYHLMRDSFLVAISAFVLFSERQGALLGHLSEGSRKETSQQPRNTPETNS